MTFKMAESPLSAAKQDTTEAKKCKQLMLLLLTHPTQCTVTYGCNKGALKKNTKMLLLLTLVYACKFRS